MSKLEKFKWNFRHYGEWKLLLALLWLVLVSFVSYQIIGEQSVPDKARPWGVALVSALTSAGSAAVTQSFYPNRGSRRKMFLIGLVLLGLGGVTSLLVSSFSYFFILAISTLGLFMILFGEKWKNSSP